MYLMRFLLLPKYIHSNLENIKDQAESYKGLLVYLRNL